MTFVVAKISEQEYTLNKLKMLSSVSVSKLAKRMGIDEKDLPLHPDFITEAEKMIDEITF